MRPFRLGARVRSGIRSVPRCTGIQAKCRLSTSQRRENEQLSSNPTDGSHNTDVRQTGVGVDEYSPSRSILPREQRQVSQPYDKISHFRVGSSFFHPAELRDACTCPKCVDPSSTQKNFQTTDIPANLQVRSSRTKSNGDLHIQWANDLPGYDENHVTVFRAGALKNPTPNSIIRNRTYTGKAQFWTRAKIEEDLEYVNYDDYIKHDKVLARAVWSLVTHGIVIIRGVPESEKSVEHLALRIGNIRDTLYGRTWDVRSIPDAKNVAYTAKNLGLHQDLLYMANPPGYQFLHCLKNSAHGGSSVFSDGFAAVKTLDPEATSILTRANFAFQYKNAGEHYYHTHPLIEKEYASKLPLEQRLHHINYSPPFQANFLLPDNRSPTWTSRVFKAMGDFAKAVEHPNHVLEYKLKEGECVIFNNRRVLHGRKQFDAAGGERWLKGTYVDTDVLNSKYNVLHERFGPVKQREGGNRVFPRIERRVTFGHGATNDPVTPESITIDESSLDDVLGLSESEDQGGKSKGRDRKTRERVPGT